MRSEGSWGSERPSDNAAYVRWGTLGAGAVSMPRAARAWEGALWERSKIGWSIQGCCIVFGPARPLSISSPSATPLSPRWSDKTDQHS